MKNSCGQCKFLFGEKFQHVGHCSKIHKVVNKLQVENCYTPIDEEKKIKKKIIKQLNLL